MPDLTRMFALPAIALAMVACTPVSQVYRQQATPGAEQAVIKGYSRNFLFAADEMAFDLAALETQTHVPYLSHATVNPGRYCVQARRWTMLLRASEMTMSESACFDAEAGHTYLIRRRDNGFSVIDRRNPTVITAAASNDG